MVSTSFFHEKDSDDIGRIDKPLSGCILAALNILSLEWQGNNLLTVVGLLPEWVLEDFEGVWSEEEPYETEPFEAAEFSPFLENFVMDAQQYWEEGHSEPMRSGIWTEVGTSGQEIHLEAIALLVNERPMILIESAELAVVEKTDWLQTARQAQLENLLQRKLAAAQIIKATVYDSLTALHDRAAFISQLNSRFDTSQWSEQRQFAVIVLNLERFSHLNNSMGSAAGDQVLTMTANRIRECLRKHDVAARFNSDEFGILVNYTERDRDVITLVKRLLAKIAEPFLLEGQSVRVSASVGIATREDWHEQAQEVLSDADLAMRQARKVGEEKRKGSGGNYVLFQREMRSRTLESWNLASELQHAIERCELELWYQPVINLATHRPESFEALIRWIHPAQGLISPDTFLPIAEASGLILDIDQWVLNRACQTLQQWQNKTSQPVKLTVNFSDASFAQTDWFMRVKKAIRRFEIMPESLCLEISERLLLERNQERNQQMTTTLAQLKTLGIAMTIDDCSTGYASLDFLRDLALNKLKIDGCFIEAMQTDKTGIVATIIELAHRLNYGIAAKKVETVEQYRALKALGCDAIQGYFFSQPVSIADAQSLISNKFVVSKEVPLNREAKHFRETKHFT
ncbi:MAG: EAL domain-containing protein [Phormidesmis sp.]